MSTFKIDTSHVTKSCAACGGVVVTSPTATPVCARCRAKGLCGSDELAHAAQQRDAFVMSTAHYVRQLETLVVEQPPPLTADYDSNEAEDAAIDARDYVRDWYRAQLQMILKRSTDD